MGLRPGPIKVNYVELVDGGSGHEADLYMIPVFGGRAMGPAIPLPTYHTPFHWINKHC